MTPKDFKSSGTGQVLRHPTGYHYFVPADLPPKIDFDWESAKLLSRADSALGELSGLGRALPNPQLLLGPMIAKEAVQSSRIEGTQASLTDVLQNEAAAAAPVPGTKATDVRDVRNYITSLEYGVKRLAELPLSLRLVRELHERLLAGTASPHLTPGHFRTSQNWIGPKGSTLVTAPYVPPVLDEMHRLLHDWELYLHEKDLVPDLVQCAVLHEQFEAIHPFLDGNGRVGRLLVTLFLIERQRLFGPVLYLSDFIERHRQDYYDLLQRVRTHGEWIPWVRYFLTGVEETARDAGKRAHRLLALRQEMRQAKLPATLVDQCFSNPYVSLGTAMAVLEVSHPTATRELKRWEKAGWVREVSGRNWGKLYLAERILQAIEAPAEQAS